MTRLDLSKSDLPEKIQENLVTYMRLFAGLPGTVMEDGEAFWFVTRRGAPGSNILRARWEEEGVEQKLDALYSRIGNYIDEIEWLLFPCDRPADLGKRLETRRMNPGLGGNWLWLDLTNLAPCPAVPDGFYIELVNDDQRMAEWVRTSEAGFEGELSKYFEAYARHGYGPAACSLHYIGYLGNIPVTSGTLLDAGGTAAVYDLSTPPDYRRQGMGGALTHAMLVEARRRGYQETWIWSSDIAKSLYQKLGFIEADFGISAYRWGKY